MRTLFPTLFLFILFSTPLCYCQAHFDSVLQQLQNLSPKYINAVENKINKYSQRFTGKTEKTLEKLSRWENKKQHLLQKINPEAANRLFASGQPTFTTVLQK